MKSKRLVSCALSVCLVVVLLFGTVCATGAEITHSYDFSKPGSEYNKTLSSADILKRYLGEELSSVESDYLVSFGEIKIEYDDAITTAYVTADADGDVLTVRAREYSYLSTAGITVVWKPALATLLGTELALLKNGGADFYEAIFEVENAETLSDIVTVRYTVSFDVSSDDINSLINKAYSDAPRLRDEIAAAELLYQERYAEYLLAVEKYEKYLQDKADYEDALAAYEDYLVKYNVYKEALDKYNAYQSAVDGYDAALAAYEKYLSDMEKYDAAYAKYAVYLSEKRIYDQKMSEYNEYLALVAEYKYHLSILRFAERPMTPLGRVLYKAIYGNLVKTVLDERDTLESKIGGSVPPAVIDLAETATERLKELLKPYFALEGNVDKYYYYATYYEDFKNSFSDLLCALDYLYSNETVRGFIGITGNDEKYRILLAQLYVIANALSDEPIKSIDPSYLAGSADAKKYKQFVFDDTYRIFGQTITEVLYNYKHIVEDTDSAEPFKESFPTPVEKPTAPKKVTEPKKPTTVTMPVIPEEPPLPGTAPEIVENPGNAPTRVENPGEAPTSNTISSEIAALVSAYEENELQSRNMAADEDFTYVVTKDVAKRIGPDVEKITVSFYDTDGVSHLFSTEVDKGTPVSYAGNYIPTRPEDERASYSFVGWQTAAGESIALASIDSDINLYPRFEETVKEYTVTWSINGNTFTDSVPYGTVPVCSYPLEKADDEYKFYTFSGFDKTVLSVTGNVCYTAVFSQEYIVPTSNGGGGVTFDSDGYTVNLYSTFDTEYKIGRILQKSRGIYPVILNTRYAKIVLSPGTVSTLIGEGVSNIGFSISSTASASYTYLLETENSAGNRVESTARVEVYAPCSFQNNDRLGLYYTNGNAEHSADFVISDATFSSSLLPWRTYELRYEYRLTLVANDLITAALQKNVYNVGESVNLTLDVPDGIMIASAVLRLENGEVIEVDLPSLVMPMSDATLIITAEYIKYKIVFQSDGVVVSTQYCKLGELPTPPVSPVKASDGEYMYEFAGWTAEIEPATRNTVYFASYTRIPIEKVDTGGRITIFMLLNLAAALAFSCFFLVIPSIVVNVKVMKRFKAGIVKNTEKTE